MMENPISEAASKNRGRPRLLDSHYEKTWSQLWGPDLSRKTIQERYYAMRAVNTLGGMDGRTERYPRLFPTAEAFQWTLLAELGRLEDDETLREFARQFCETSLSVKGAVARIRAYRTGKGPTPDLTRLAGLLAGVVDQYRSSTGCTWQLVLSAVEKLQRVCESLDNSEGEDV